MNEKEHENDNLIKTSWLVCIYYKNLFQVKTTMSFTQIIKRFVEETFFLALNTQRISFRSKFIIIRKYGSLFVYLSNGAKIRTKNIFVLMSNILVRCLI